VNGLEMTGVAILTDSVAQIPPDMAQHYHIRVIPLSIIGQESFRDGIDILPGELYQRMRREMISPRTSHPSAGEYITYFQRCLEDGAQSLLYFSLSGKLSGAFSTATKAAQLVEEENPGIRVMVFDTRTATIAQGFMAINAATAAQAGLDFESIVKQAQEERSKVGFIAMLETLEYLERGGRIGKAAYMVGSQIHIKPVLTIDKDGLVTPVSVLRCEKKCVEKLVNCMAARVGNDVPVKVGVMHADNLEKAERLKQLVQDRYQLEEVFITDFTPVMGAHAGPGVLGLGYRLA
jgi:DegV family protein with EDD domain